MGALVEDIIEADARDLTRWPDDSFDAALSLGPFYHLPDPADRERAAAELARVLKPGGLAFVALHPAAAHAVPPRRAAPPGTARVRATTAR